MMYGDWVVQLDDGSHTVHAEVNDDGFWTNELMITWDDLVVDSSRIWYLHGDLKSFQRNGHTFLIGIRGFGVFRRLVLSIDGVEVPKSGLVPLGKEAPPLAAVQFVKDLSVKESEEIIGTEQYPLDNRLGDQPLTTARQISREATNELSIDTSSQFSSKVGLDVLSAIKAEMEAEVSRQTGRKIGEKVTESQTLTFSAGPRSSVVYEVIWKRKVRSGERLYVSGGIPMTIPYRISYGLSCEVRTLPQTSGH
jgi:hypothetical protein